MKKILFLFTALLFVGSLMTVKAADTWTVAGSNTTILGSEWNTAQSAGNDMKNTNGSNWYLLKVNKSGTITLQYKVAKNHAWTTAYPSNNASISLSGTSYDVLFKFDASSNSVSAAKITSWTVAGSQAVLGSDWSTSDSNNKMSRSGSNYTLTKSDVSLKKNTNYECKVLANKAWTYAFPSSNKVFTVSEDGTYDVTFTFNTSTFAVNVTTIKKGVVSSISYPASPSHYTLASGNPTSGEAGETINFTATPDENYFLTVTVNGTAVAGNNNVYSFTMPAQNVTVAITATSYRVFDGSTPIYLKADAVSWWLDASAVQKATFTKADNSTETVTGVLEEGVTYAFTPGAGAYKSVQFSRHNPSNVSEDWGHTDHISLIGTEPKDYVTEFAPNSTNATWSTFVPSPSYIFTSGTTIYYDFTAYDGGINTYVGGVEVWNPNTDKVVSQTLSADWKVTTSTKLWRCGAGGSWNDYYCTTLPTEGKNMIVSTDGINYTWGTYVPPVDPTVEFVSLGNTIALGTTANFAATSTNIENPVYTFFVKKGSSAYGSAVTSYTFAEAGTYTVKVEVDGDESKHAEATKDVTVVEGAHVIYFVNNSNWEQVYAHMWGVDPGTEWPGDEMTLTSLLTEKNKYTVYAVTFTPNYPELKFNNGLGIESGNQTIDYTKPYYYNGQWYATLAECDPITVNLSGLVDKYLVGENATLSATSNLTNASYAYEVKIGEGEFAELENNPYTFAAAGTYTFKVIATGDEGNAGATQTVTVYEPLTLYFVNKEGWANVNAYFYTPEKIAWPGEAMTLTEATTAKHHYTVYSVIVGAGAHANIIFNNNNGAQTGDLTINSAKPYYYDGEWYATLAEIDPETYVEFEGVGATIPANTPLTLAATSNVTNPTYNYYAKPENGDYEAITSPHTFNAVGKYTLKVEALENGAGDPVAYREKDVEVYTTYTFTSGTTIYVDFSAVSGDLKGINFPNYNDATIAHDAAGAGTIKTVKFTADVTWSTLNDFIKTEKAGWAGQRFIVPAEGQNGIIVAADGASYEWVEYVPAVELKGGWDSWADALTLTGDETSVSITKYLTGGTTYEFKTIVAGQWRGNGGTFDRDHTSAENIGEGDNMKLTADVDGDYTFTWTFANNGLSFTFPSPTPVYETVRENLTINKYYTICLPKKVVEYQGATFWNMNKRGATMAYIEEVSDTELPAGTPYIFQATAETLQVIYEGAAKATPVESGALRGTFAAMDQDALSAAATAAGSDIYLLSNNTLWNVTTTGASGNSLSAGRAYVLYEELEYVAAAPSSAPGKRVRGVSMNTNVATGIDALNASEQPMKMIIDGQLFIIRGEKMYNANGQVVK